jgi:hypothetical protein
MSTHTPGPWVRAGSNVVTAPTETRVGGFCVAQCNTMMDGNIANARLIAAAPDLLDALDRIRKDLQRMSDGYSADLDVMVDVARAAVAKATE